MDCYCPKVPQTEILLFSLIWATFFQSSTAVSQGGISLRATNEPDA